MKFTTGTSCTNANKWICTKRQRAGEDLHHLGPDTLAVVAAQPDMDDLAALMARGRDHDGNIQPGVAGEEGAGEGSLQQNVVFAALAAGQHLAADVLGDGVHLPAAGLLFALMDFTDVIAGRTTLAQAVVRHPLYPNLYLLTAPVSFGVRLPSKREMQRLIDEIRRHFDFCLIDAAAGIGEAFALATCCADRAVVVTTNDPSSLRDAQRTVMELHRFPSGYLHLVVNRVRRKLLQSLHTTIDDAIDAAGLPLLGVIPEDENVPAVLGRGLSQRLKYHSGALCACENIARRLCGERVRLMRL